MQMSTGATGLDSSLASSILAALTDTVLIIDEMGRLLFVTSDGNDVLGQEPSYWVGRSALDVVHPDDLDLVVGHIQDAFRGVDNKRRFASLRLGTNGLWFPVEAFGFNRLDFGGTPALLISIRDTTGALWIAQARRRADRAIAQRGFAQGDIAADSVGSAMMDSLRPHQQLLHIDVALTNFATVSEVCGEECAQRAMAAVRDRLTKQSRQEDIVLQIAQDRLMVTLRGVENTRTAYLLAERVFTSCERGLSSIGLGDVSLQFQVGFALASTGDDFAAVRAFAATEAQFSSIG